MLESDVAMLIMSNHGSGVNGPGVNGPGVMHGSGRMVPE